MSVIEKVLVLVWFVVFGVGGILVVVNFRGIAEAILSRLDRYSPGGPGGATVNTIRLIAAIFVLVVISILPTFIAHDL